MMGKGLGTTVGGRALRFFTVRAGDALCPPLALLRTHRFVLAARRCSFQTCGFIEIYNNVSNYIT
jgi:hypothetical protein